MSANFKNLFVGTNVLALLAFATAVSAAPSLGINRPYYGSNNQGSNVRSYRTYAPAFRAETRQSFSYEPAEKVQTNGHCHNHAVAPPAARRTEAKQDTAKAPKSTRRSYSYEPVTPSAPPARVDHRRSGINKDAWRFQKTDPRRNRR